MLNTSFFPWILLTFGDDLLPSFTGFLESGGALLMLRELRSPISLNQCILLVTTCLCILRCFLSSGSCLHNPFPSFIFIFLHSVQACLITVTIYVVLLMSPYTHTSIPMHAHLNILCSILCPLKCIMVWLLCPLKCITVWLHSLVPNKILYNLPSYPFEMHYAHHCIPFISLHFVELFSFHFIIWFSIALRHCFLLCALVMSHWNSLFRFLMTCIIS